MTRFFQTLSYVIIGLFALDIMVIVHELGHYAVARLFHIEIDCLQVGFGPEIKRSGKYGTKFSLAAIPFGGACKLDTLSLYSAHPVKRILMYLAGPAANTLYATVLFTAFLLLNNTPIVKALTMALKQCAFEIKMFRTAIGQVLTGKAKIGEILSGAFQASQNIGQLTANGFKSGFIAGINVILYLFASVSLSLGVANMLPIPALDGGFIIISLVEMITGRTFSEKFYLVVQITGLVLLLAVLPIARQF